jgi:hypothetical protein
MMCKREPRSSDDRGIGFPNLDPGVGLANCKENDGRKHDVLWRSLSIANGTLHQQAFQRRLNTGRVNR